MVNPDGSTEAQKVDLIKHLQTEGEDYLQTTVQGLLCVFKDVNYKGLNIYSTRNLSRVMSTLQMKTRIRPRHDSHLARDTGS